MKHYNGKKIKRSDKYLQDGYTYWKDSENNLFILNMNIELPPNAEQITLVEMEQLTSVELTQEQLADKIRLKRNELLEEVSWQLERYERQVALGVEPTDSNEWYMEALAYAQELRDVPQQPNFPHEIIWPILEQPHEN